MNFKKTEIGSNRPVSVRFGYFRTKTITQPIGFGSVSIQLFYIKNQKLYCFFGFFFVISNGFGFNLARYFWFGSVFLFSVRFRLIELKSNRTSWFFKYSNRFNRFFLWFGFFGYFFFGFLSLIGFSIFLLTPNATSLSCSLNKST